MSLGSCQRLTRASPTSPTCVLANLSINYWPVREPNSVEYGGSLQVINLFDQRNLINFFSDFSGTRFNQQRRILLNGMVRF